MKSLNLFKFVSETSVQVEKCVTAIKEGTSYQEVKHIENYAIGYIDCMATMLNTMICKENNDITGDLDECIDNLGYKVYNAALNKAIESNEDCNVIKKLGDLRDKCR